jgi:hypothetical protein
MNVIMLYMYKWQQFFYNENIIYHIGLAFREPFENRYYTYYSFTFVLYVRFTN